MFPCILQLPFLVVELTGILISLGKRLRWKGSLFRLVRAFRCSVSQQKVPKPWERWVLMFAGCGVSRSSVPRPQPSDWSGVGERGIAYPMVLSPPSRNPILPHALMYRYTSELLLFCSTDGGMLATDADGFWLI